MYKSDQDKTELISLISFHMTCEKAFIVIYLYRDQYVHVILASIHCQLENVNWTLESIY